VSDLPGESLGPLAGEVERVLARHGYELEAAVEAIDAAVPGHGGLFDPRTGAGELSAAVGRVLEEEPPPRSRCPSLTGEPAVLYVDGSSRGNPGPAGAGAVLQDAEGATVARLGRPVGSRAGNNTAEYAALTLGLEGLLARCEPADLEVRIDSMTVIGDVWGDRPNAVEGRERYRRAILKRLAELPAHDWRHLADSDPNPADALATVGADIAALGPGG
jgi:ribonuclease HI